MTARAITSPPPSSTHWLAAVTSADFTANADLPHAVFLSVGATVVVIDAAGTSMLIDTVGRTLCVAARLGVVVGTAWVLY